MDRDRGRFPVELEANAGNILILAGGKDDRVGLPVDKSIGPDGQAIVDFRLEAVELKRSEIVGYCFARIVRVLTVKRDFGSGHHFVLSVGDGSSD